MSTFSDFLSKLSKIGLGCEQLGGVDWGTYDLRETINAVRAALDCGINVFDTANVYGLGRSEELLSKALGSKRNNVCIISKFGVYWNKNEGFKEKKRANTYFSAEPTLMRKSLECSLKRLKIESIPIFLLHWPISNADYSELIEELEKCKKEGKIQYYGISNFYGNDLEKFLNTSKTNFIENSFNIIDRRPINEVFQYISSRDIGFFAYGVLAQGLLTGKYSNNSKFDNTDRRFRLDHFKKIYKYSQLLDYLQLISKECNCSQSQLAIKWVVSNKNVTSAIVGAKNSNQVVNNFKASDIDIKEDILIKISELVQSINENANS